jgi:hypothetical protein
LHQCQNKPGQFRARKAAPIGGLRSFAVPRTEWLDARHADLLPVPYIHVVFHTRRRDRPCRGALYLGQSLDHHPHVHCIVPRGGVSPDRTCRIAGKPGFFLPVRVLSSLFRRRFRANLDAASGPAGCASQQRLQRSLIRQPLRNAWPGCASTGGR